LFDELLHEQRDAQQTQAGRVAVAFEAWIERFPTVESLAAAGRADVLRAWQGLGYNRRAVSLHRAAEAVMTSHGGRVPIDPAALRTRDLHYAGYYHEIQFGRLAKAIRLFDNFGKTEGAH
jgi:adenine-specific DNA glycosylase